MANTGNVVFLTLEEYYVNGPQAGQATGFTKANNTSDPDYVAPVPDSQVSEISCPVGGTTTESITVNPSSHQFSSSAQNNSSFTVTATSSFSITNLSSKPSWLTISVNGNIVNIGASPNTTGSFRNFTIDLALDSNANVNTDFYVGQPTSDGTLQ